MERTVVTVTALKAPWPEGAVIGSKVGFAGQPPAWALGKFASAPEGAKADFDYEPADLVGDGAGVALPSVDAINAQVADLTEKLRAAHLQIEGQADSIKTLIADLKGGIADAKVLEDKLAAAEAANATLTSDKDAALADAADARNKLAAAEAAAVDAAANAGNTAKKK